MNELIVIFSTCVMILALRDLVCLRRNIDVNKKIIKQQSDQIKYWIDQVDEHLMMHEMKKHKAKVINSVDKV